MHIGYYNILIWLSLLFCHGCRPSIGKIYLCRWMVAEGFKIGIQYPFVVGNWQTSSAKLESGGENLCTKFCNSDHMTCNRVLDKEESVKTVERLQECFQRQPWAVLIVGSHDWKLSRNLTTVFFVQPGMDKACIPSNFIKTSHFFL